MTVQYVVYEVATKHRHGYKLYTLQGAKNVCTRLNKKPTHVVTHNPYAYATVEEFAEIRKSMGKRVVKNLMSGQEIEIDYDTPACCDPSQESYWSM